MRKAVENKEYDVIELTIPAREERVGIVRLCVSGIGAQMNFTIDEIEDLKMAVGEATNNAIFHGYGNQNTLDEVVWIKFEIYPSKLQITVKDNGKGFDVKIIEGPAVQNKQEVLQEKGLGVFLIKSLMDEVDFTSSPNGTKLKMVKNKRA